MSEAELLQEIADRARRTETRLTKLALHMGVDAGGEKPQLTKGGTRLQVPTRKVSLDDMMAAVPAFRRNDHGIDVYYGDDYVCTLSWP